MKALVIISYDISDNRKRTKFSKYLCKFRYRLQYLVFTIENSEKVLSNIITNIENKFAKKFYETDSIYIFKLNPLCDIRRYGYARNEEKEIIVI